MRKTLTNGQPRLMETDHVLVDMGAVRGRGGEGEKTPICTKVVHLMHMF